MAPQAKKFRARCKNIAIYTTESLNEPFFAEHNMKTGAAGKKKIEGTASRVNPTEFSRKKKRLLKISRKKKDFPT